MCEGLVALAVWPGRQVLFERAIKSLFFEGAGGEISLLSLPCPWYNKTRNNVKIHRIEEGTV